MGKGFGIASFIFGLISIPICLVMTLFGSITQFYSLIMNIPNITIILSVVGYGIPALAIIFGIIGIIVDSPKGFAIAGLVLGIIAIILGLTVQFLMNSLLNQMLPVSP